MHLKKNKNGEISERGIKRAFNPLTMKSKII